MPVIIANPYAPPIGTAPAEPVRLEFETPPQAFMYPERPEHPDVWQLLELAECGASEDERRAAVETLVSIFQQQASEVRHGQRRQVDPPLIRFLTERSLRAVASTDPVKAAQFLEPTKPGRRASSAIAARDLQIASEVVQLMDSGMTLFEATSVVEDRIVADGECLSRDRIEKIYEARRWEARASRHGRI